MTTMRVLSLAMAMAMTMPLLLLLPLLLSLLSLCKVSLDDVQSAMHVLTDRHSRGYLDIDQEWPLKRIAWPPFVDYPRDVQILCQSENGPCSLIALINVLSVRLTRPAQASKQGLS